MLSYFIAWAGLHFHRAAYISSNITVVCSEGYQQKNLFTCIVFAWFPAIWLAENYYKNFVGYYIP